MTHIEKKLYKMDNFTARPYMPREWTSTDTLQIPFTEQKHNWKIPRLKKSLKRVTNTESTTPIKIQKQPEMTSNVHGRG